MGRTLLLVMIAVSGLGLLASVVLLATLGRGRPVDGGPPIPEFVLTDQDGRPIDQSVLDGRYTLMDFMFTSCPLWCPGMTQAMRHVQDETAGTGLRLLSVSIDGQHDTPEVLSAYAQSNGADPSRWVFATGEPEAVWAMAARIGFDVSYDEATPVQRAGSDDTRMINHPTRLLLIGPDRRLLGLYDYLDDADLRDLIQRVRGLSPP